MLCLLALLSYRHWRRSPFTDEKASILSIAAIERSRDGGFSAWLHDRVRGQKWTDHAGYQPKLRRTTVEESVRLSRNFLLKSQKPAGNFNYGYDFVAKTETKSDNQVRQAGVLWGLALLDRQHADPEVRPALERALDFFLARTEVTGESRAAAIAYPGAAECQSGTVALTALAIIEYLQNAAAGKANFDPGRRKQLDEALDGYLRHLELMRLANQHFSSAWSWSKHARVPTWDPFTDGECLLCFVKAAKCLGIARLVPQIESSLAHFVRHYTAGEWPRNPDSELTEGFFQWGCLALWEYRDTAWKGADLANDYLLTMGWWLIHVHDVLDLPGNAGSSFEGLIPCWLVAKETGAMSASHEMAWTIDQGLRKFITWQVAGPLREENPFLRAHATTDPRAVGGVMLTQDDPALRIDITVHQLHALLLAERFFFEREMSP